MALSVGLVRREEKLLRRGAKSATMIASTVMRVAKVLVVKMDVDRCCCELVLVSGISRRGFCDLTKEGGLI